jgi:hypothetical protein
MNNTYNNNNNNNNGIQILSFVEFEGFKKCKLTIFYNIRIF